MTRPRSVNRRRFLSSSLVGGAALSLTTSDAFTRSVSADENPCVAYPTAIDSLSMAVQFLNDVTGAPLCALHEEIIGSTERLATRCKVLVNLIEQLTAEVPELAENESLNRINELANKGAGEFGQINPLTSNSLTLVPASFATAITAFDRENMLELSKQLSNQQRTIVLTQKAVEILKSLLGEIKRLCQDAETAHTQAKRTSDSSEDVFEKVKTIREKINTAVSELQARQKNDAFKKLDEADTLLAGIDTFYFTHLKNLSTPRQEKCERWYGTKSPTQFLREYLAAARELVNEEIAFSNGVYGENSFRIIKAGFQPNPGLFDIQSAIGQVLQEIMIRNIWPRRWLAYIYVRPLLRYTGDSRISKLKEVFPKLSPEGPHDRDTSKAEKAAKRLAELLAAKGL